MKILTAKRRSRPIATASLALLALALAGCGGKRTAPQTVSAAAPVRDAEWARRQLQDALAALNAGDSVRARPLLIELLTVQPGDMLAQNLLKQIDTDPKLLLGTQNYRYTVKDGDTMSSIAQHFLGDPTMAYALSRYNDLASPLGLTPGQSILIPGKRKPAATAKKSAPAAKKPAATAKAPPAPAKPAQPAGNPAQAAKLRGEGLAAMNGGAINRAVVLFRQALAYDPNNALIKGDLARALRIQGTLTGHP
jgi:hypothetical protein